MSTFLIAEYPYTIRDILKWQNEKRIEWGFLPEDEKHRLVEEQKEIAQGFLFVCKEFFASPNGEKERKQFADSYELPEVREFLEAVKLIGFSFFWEGVIKSKISILEKEEIDCSKLYEYFNKEQRTMLASYLIIWLEALFEKENTAPDEVPELQNLNKLTEGTSPVLRKWTRGKYKCCSLERFIKEYQKLSDYLTPALIRDYLISDRNGKPYTDSTIEQRIKEYRT